jgi:hypothetical protein
VTAVPLPGMPEPIERVAPSALGLDSPGDYTGRPEPEQHTEASLLALLRRRCTIRSQGVGERYVFATHVRAGSGFDQRTADAVTLDCWQGGNRHDPAHDLEGFEVKVSRGDWLRELKDPHKSQAVRRYCARWWLLAPSGIVRADELPDGWGLMVARGSLLRAEVQAPRLQPEPVPRGFWVAFARAAVKTEQRRREVST